VRTTAMYVRRKKGNKARINKIMRGTKNTQEKSIWKEKRNKNSELDNSL
jgi:hypothetical protein